MTRRATTTANGWTQRSLFDPPTVRAITLSRTARIKARLKKESPQRKKEDLFWEGFHAAIESSVAIQEAAREAARAASRSD